MSAISDKTIGRLTLYRRILAEAAREELEHLHSHQLANRAGVTAAQVRRDLMVVGYEGSPRRGYQVVQLLEALTNFLDEPGSQRVALVGIGNLGRALLAYFLGPRGRIPILAAFDIDNQKTGRVIHGCRCLHLDQLESVARDQQLNALILAVPQNAAQEVTDRAVRCGIRGIVNFAPVPLQVPPGVYVEQIDMTMALEKVLFFARSKE